MRESAIRKALKVRVEAYGGEIRAVSWLGRRNAPDVLCLVAPVGALWTEPNARPGTNCFVETKRPGKGATAAQAREHERMRAAGCVVVMVRDMAELDAWLPPL